MQTSISTLHALLCCSTAQMMEQKAQWFYKQDLCTFVKFFHSHDYQFNVIFKQSI